MVVRERIFYYCNRANGEIMKNPKRKAIVGFILLVVSIGIFGLFTGVSGLFYNIIVNSQRQGEKTVRSISETILNSEMLRQETWDQFLQNHTACAEFTAELLSQTISEGSEGELRTFESGFMIMRNENGDYEFPAEIGSDEAALVSSCLSEKMKEDPSFGRKAGYIDLNGIDEKYRFVFYAPVGDSYSFIELVDSIEFNVYMASRDDSYENLRSIEDAYGIRLFLFRDMNEDDVILLDNVVYFSNGMANYDISFEGRTVQDISDELLGRFAENTTISRLNDDLLIMISVPGSFTAESMNRDMTVTFSTVLLLGSTLIIWIVSVYGFVKDHTLNEDQRNRYNPERLRVIVLSFVVLSTVLAFLGAYLSWCIINLRMQSSDSSTVMEVLKYRIGEIESNEEFADMLESEDSRLFGSRLAELLGLYPELITKKNLEMCREKSGVNSITLFDEDGNEIVSTTDMINLSLGTDPEDKMTEFRRILKGVEYIWVKDIPMFDMDSTVKQSVNGTRVTLPGGKYGALLLGIVGSSVDSAAVTDPNKIMDNMVMDDSILIAADIEINDVIYCSDSAMIGADIVNLGISETNQRDRATDFYLIDQNKYYGTSKLIDKYVYYYMVKESSIYKDVLIYALFDSLTVFIVLSILAVYLLFGYTNKVYEEYSKIGTEKHRQVRNDFTPENLRRTARKEKGQFNPIQAWKDAFPEQKTLIVLVVLVAFNCYHIFRNVLTTGFDYENGSIFNFLLSGTWTRGLNIFSFCAVLIIGAGIFIVTLLVGIFSRLLRNILDAKGETICRLVMNLLRYLAVLVFLYYALSYLGVDTRALLVGAGIVGLIISLGARDLVTDLLSGILIVFEGEFRVGDIIEINGFRGTVLEIGVRATKLLGRGGNIKTIPNRDVANTINLTRMNSWYVMEVKIPKTISLGDTEAMLRKELPDIGKRIPEIIKGPHYKGVTAISGNLITLSITAECDEDDYFTVQSKLNREIFLLFSRHEIPIS